MSRREAFKPPEAPSSPARRVQTSQAGWKGRLSTKRFKSRVRGCGVRRSRRRNLAQIDTLGNRIGSHPVSCNRLCIVASRTVNSLPPRPPAARSRLHVALSNVDDGTIIFYMNVPVVSASVKEALAEVIKRRQALVIWGGEFGRTPMSESGSGRDHNPYGFTMWMAGGGVKPGIVYGATDEIGLYAVDRPAHIHDVHATILALLGLDHELLTLSHNGRDERLTMTSGTVIREIMA